MQDQYQDQDILRQLVCEGKLVQIEEFLEKNRGVAKKLIDSNPNNEKKPILHIATHFGSPTPPVDKSLQPINIQLVSLLLAYGADIEAVNVIGQTAFTCAIVSEDWPMAKFLLEKGANIDRITHDLENKSQSTYLTDAIIGQRLQTAQFLLDHGADAGYSDAENKPLLQHITRIAHFPKNKIRAQLKEWWECFLNNGAGIGVDFDSVCRSPLRYVKSQITVEFLREVTKNKIIFYATIEGKSVDRTTPGFEEALTNVQEVADAVDKEDAYLHGIIKKLQKGQLPLINSERRKFLIWQFEKIQRLRSLTNLTIEYAIRHIFHINPEKINVLPIDLHQQIRLKAARLGVKIPDANVDNAIQAESAKIDSHSPLSQQLVSLSPAAAHVGVEKTGELNPTTTKTRHSHPLRKTP